MVYIQVGEKHERFKRRDTAIRRLQDDYGSSLRREVPPKSNLDEVVEQKLKEIEGGIRSTYAAELAQTISVRPGSGSDGSVVNRSRE